MRLLIAASALTLAALTAQPALAQTGTARYCLTDWAGTAQCTFQSMAQCEQVRTPGAPLQCTERSMLEGTVGYGSPRSAPSTSPFGGAVPPVGDAGQR
jgi:hypothetical protein